MLHTLAKEPSFMPPPFRPFRRAAKTNGCVFRCFDAVLCCSAAGPAQLERYRREFARVRTIGSQGFAVCTGRIRARKFCSKQENAQRAPGIGGKMNSERSPSIKSEEVSQDVPEAADNGNNPGNDSGETRAIVTGV
ncbi:hypothetical protein ZHAS_00004768 [Anopheles sinensis]|uniref:Uncharacterized protein n=1 Tax=Anopheles sinensis TaxID=74873 RepID=A0A084VHU4_ANOSI|nr:hypothetical protein ZHAS_00004768 [Anopheles sinensis]